MRYGWRKGHPPEMLDLAAIRAAFPEMSNLVGLSESGQKDVLRGLFEGDAAVLKLVRKTADGAAKIEREIEAAAQLACDYVPTLYAWGQRDIDGETRYYLIEQYIDGETLRERLAREPVQPFSEVLRLARVLLRACADFEACGFVHRDIKPENILVVRQESTGSSTLASSASWGWNRSLLP
jgi:eukaryotic-like serine/threonine-protein kinase